MLKTAYLEIHEREYQRLIKSDRPSWSDPEDIANRLKLLKKFLDQQSKAFRGLEVAVLGCGDGEHLLELSERGANVTGIDIAPTAIEWANRKAKLRKQDVRLLVGDVLHLPFTSSRFDLVIDDHCLHCIIGADRKLFFSEAKRIMKSGAILFIRTMCGDMPPDCSEDLLRMFDPASRCQVHDGIAGRYFGLSDSILNEITESGLQIAAHSSEDQEEGGQLLNVFAIKH